MEKNSNVVDEVIEHVEKGEKLKERAIKKIKQDKDVRKYISDIFSLIVGVLVLLVLFFIPNIISYFYVKDLHPLEVVRDVLYLIILCTLLVRNYITLRKINTK